MSADNKRRRCEPPSLDRSQIYVECPRHKDSAFPDDRLFLLRSRKKLKDEGVRCPACDAQYRENFYRRILVRVSRLLCDPPQTAPELVGYAAVVYEIITDALSFLGGWDNEDEDASAHQSDLRAAQRVAALFQQQTAGKLAALVEELNVFLVRDLFLSSRATLSNEESRAIGASFDVDESYEEYEELLSE